MYWFYEWKETYPRVKMNVWFYEWKVMYPRVNINVLILWFYEAHSRVNIRVLVLWMKSNVSKSKHKCIDSMNGKKRIQEWRWGYGSMIEKKRIQELT